MGAPVQPQSDHDACGVGFIAHIRGRASRDIVSHGLSALRRLTHRGAEASLGAVDACGVLTAIPWTWVADAFGGRLSSARIRGLGMLLVHPSDRLQAAEIIERELRHAGARSIDWRIVPIDPAAVLCAQRDTVPNVLQVVAGFEDGRQTADAALYRARLRIEEIAPTAGVRLTIASLSTRTVVHKALVTPESLDRFFPDLADERFVSPFITFHQRCSTNMPADWALAQPWRSIAHSGEINTIAGNRLWMRARAADATALPGFGPEPPISGHGSDSLSLDDAIELLRHSGYSLAHAVSRLVPPAWEGDRDLPPDVRAFYEFQSLVSEPWDGPSALIFADGRYVGAALDRNGLRPARVVSTAGDLIAVASEVGVLPADEHEIVNRGRLGPGDMVMVDLERGSVTETNEIRRRLAFRRRYRRLVADVVRPLADPASGDPGATGADGDLRPVADLVRRQAAAGCSREELELLLKPRAADGCEAVHSTADYAAPAALSQRSPLFSGFFRQRFAQVTNRSVDPYRESLVLSLTTMLGGHGSFIDELAPRPARIVMRSPILSRRELEQLARSPALQPVAIDIVCAAGGGVEAFDLRLQTMADEACAAVERGSALILLTDRRLSADLAAVPALLAQAAVHHALVNRGLRLRTSIIVDTGDARDAHQIGLLVGYGASAVCPSLAYDTIAAVADADPTGCDVAVTRYRLALERGLRTLMSKVGVCTVSGYCGAQPFEIVGLHPSLLARFFPGTPSPAGGATLADIAATTLARHQRAFADQAPDAGDAGLHDLRLDRECHATNAIVVQAPTGGPACETFTSHVHGRPASAIRDLLELVSSETVRSILPFEFVDPVGLDHPLSVAGSIANTDRAFGVGVAGAIAARFGDRGLPDGSVHLAMTGSAGQCFGAFCMPGMRLSLVGDANDGLGKGMHGGEIVVAPAARERGRANQVLAGNGVLYGATGGRLFLAGLAGERFAVRNSGATAVVEGVGDHSCEHMTAGVVVVLGSVGQNFASGMTGGVIYVAGSRASLAARTHPQQLAIDAATPAEQRLLRELLETHERLTGSRVARGLLRLDRHLAGFCRVTPAAAGIAAPLVEPEPVAQAG
jgi:glutamate synthase domain-containing protein 1/glutamate synthase domain-containing protein 3